ncbi:chromate transporter [Sporocytophaga myxococcoides]|uniref:Chromate transporter n=1 Tax=Sporocytophaga myxococcoides TaxID=153721 RepID=A0A098LGF7_9BACT|nr:chromate efflux transporter [Sporocytophaga myxococcoides]GAL85522.1 chromate transporter [Sporocytophaga myxococcoides]
MDPVRIKEVCYVFLKLGIIGFGGPAAHIAMMEEEIVNKRKWISREHFLDLIGATNLIPGPNSTEMSMHCGHERAGFPGLFFGGICFIFPAALIMGILAWLYASYGSIPEVKPFLYGIKPAIIAIIINAIYKLGKTALKNWQLGLIGTGVVIASLAGINEIYALLCAGLIAIIWFSGKDWLRPSSLSSFSPFIFSLIPFSKSITLGELFWIFIKIGATLFGSGYVLVAYLQAEFVDKTGWLTQGQLLDAVALGQFTPGPLFTTATFIGYQMASLPGAVIATIGIFLPSFLFVLVLNPFVPKLRKSRVMSYFLDGVNIGAIGVMLAVTFELCSSVLTDLSAWFIAIASLITVFGFRKLNSTWIIAGGAIAGYLFHVMNL